MKNEKGRYELLDPDNFGEWLAEERRERGISRRVLAKGADMDLTSIAKYEIYGISPSLKNLTRILAALGLMIVIKEIDDGEEA